MGHTGVCESLCDRGTTRIALTYAVSLLRHLLATSSFGAPSKTYSTLPRTHTFQTNWVIGKLTCGLLEDAACIGIASHSHPSPLKFFHTGPAMSVLRFHCLQHHRAINADAVTASLASASDQLGAATFGFRHVTPLDVELALKKFIRHYSEWRSRESTAIHGSVPAQWLIEFEQRILARFDNRFDEVSGRMSRLEEAQARQEATLTHELAEAADFRAACSREMMAFQRELRGEIEVACARIVSTTAVTGPREANETEEDSCEVRFDGLPSGVDPSSTETVKKILQAMGLARFEMHIARVREWINRNPRSTDQSSSRQIVAQLSSPFIRDEVIGASPALRDLTMSQIFGVGAEGRIRASPVLPRGVYHLRRQALDLARSKSASLVPSCAD
ncbi:unnamed protein product [Trichogramma brassicae]|uniref:Uncharacterized protein n=1 Tax=Trichogramma brassicae TaxID=86971 RepID=A0A6H5HWN1_9HYME|nr:unnamed protein product [Trichogramma brassicae]